MEGKICTKCKQWKPLEEFNKKKTNKDGRQYQCRECTKEYDKRYREVNKEKKKQYYKDNVERIKGQHKQYYKDNTEHIKRQHKQYYKDNAEHIKERSKQWHENNKEHKKEYNKQWRLNNKENNLQYISNIVEQINPVMKDLPVYGYIYKFENIKTGHQYLGQSTTPLDRRYGSNVIKSWIKERKEKVNQKFKDELIEEDIIVAELFDVACCEYHLNVLEAYWINRYDSCNNGYNNYAGNHITDDGLEEFIEILEQHNLEFIDGQIVKITN